jgi:hypothetical protein
MPEIHLEAAVFSTPGSVAWMMFLRRNSMWENNNKSQQDRWRLGEETSIHCNRIQVIGQEIDRGQSRGEAEEARRNAALVRPNAVLRAADAGCGPGRPPVVLVRWSHQENHAALRERVIPRRVSVSQEGASRTSMEAVRCLKPLGRDYLG